MKSAPFRTTQGGAPSTGPVRGTPAGKPATLQPATLPADKWNAEPCGPRPPVQNPPSPAKLRQGR